MDGSGAYPVDRPDHRLFEGASLAKDHESGGKDTIVGDGSDGLPFPTNRDGTPKSFTIPANAAAKRASGDSWWYERWPGPDLSGHAVPCLHTTEGGGTVVTCGSIDRAHTGHEGGPEDVTRNTRNVLERLGKYSSLTPPPS